MRGVALVFGAGVALAVAVVSVVSAIIGGAIAFVEIITQGS